MVRLEKLEKLEKLGTLGTLRRLGTRWRRWRRWRRRTLGLRAALGVSRLLPRLLLPLLLLPLLLLLGVLRPPIALADGVSTGRRVLGTLLGSVDGALLAGALTVQDERTPGLTQLYVGAVGGGAILGYAVAGNDDALTVLGVVLIPLVILNFVLPDPDPFFDRGSGVGARARSEIGHASRDRGMARGKGKGKGESKSQGNVGAWRVALVRLAPVPSMQSGGFRVTPLRLRF